MGPRASDLMSLCLRFFICKNGDTTSAHSIGLSGGLNEVMMCVKLLEQCLEHLQCSVTLNYYHYRCGSVLQAITKQDDRLFLLYNLLCLCAFVYTFPSTWSVLLHCKPCLSLSILLKYGLLHAALPDPPMGRAHFCVSTLWHLLQSYPIERA